jgi:hypothetical protein
MFIVCSGAFYFEAFSTADGLGTFMDRVHFILRTHDTQRGASAESGLKRSPLIENDRFGHLSVLITESTRSENAAKFQKARKPLTLIQMDNARAHTGRGTQEKLDVSRFKRTPQPPHSPDIAPSDFSFRLAQNPA